MHVVGGELTQGDEGPDAQQRADLGRVADADSTYSTRTLGQLSTTPEPPPRPFVLGRSIRPRMHDRAYPAKEGPRLTAA